MHSRGYQLDSPQREVVITGLGVVSPIGIGRDDFWDSLAAQRGGIGELTAFDNSNCPCKLAGEVDDFDPKQYIRPRKSLKVMCRDIQLGFAAADMAVADSGLKESEVDPERVGVIFGADLMYCDVDEIVEPMRSCIVDGHFQFDRWGSQALSEMYPLWLLKYLPNMPACHIGIAHDARGPNNSITLGDVSSLQAITEAVRVIQRNQAEVIVVGGTSSQIHPTCIDFRLRTRLTHQIPSPPSAACRPFDASRDGTVPGEGAASFVLESRAHAERRGARIVARILGYGSTFQPPATNGQPGSGAAIRAGIQIALSAAGMQPKDVGHVNAHGIATVEDDRREAQVIRELLGDVPVTAPKSFFGDIGAGSGAVEAVVSLLAFERGEIPVTLNYQQPDPNCPVNVVHGSPRPLGKPVALLLNQAPMGQAVAVVIAAEPSALA
ncbi:MAG: beta-ketoacyl-[acyl-carrier-protein] synthase family protein [Planctomycetales bacterium]|nr:beta-ketoacyl-[acyl-carrier-protein] synthase family protein [Planctomycetales bacterium]NIM09330.1 beta-ketoacyl-[acyl-carrier-protein] synthase family protein [Planctomycetales bacterium]NIN08801.1 beta-ketoacyl-[acyl-carrier-protein] synthase family protein [Planctomycetales bacterium]NIN77918.1 beta-ketoacyl-[acyl-carrier-protein] synthase family protein [Planctomycetales bacterium]NIO35101.1 beta-ketoacyl-[acyl-carrier-protein] synthase family protein [Planctomycetales bacterium]